MRGGGGRGSSVVGVGVIVGDGAERESVLRPDCLPSGEKLCQHPLKWPASEQILCRVEAIRASRNSLAVIKVTELLRHRHAPLLSSYFQKSDFIQSGGQQKHTFVFLKMRLGRLIQAGIGVA